MKIANKISRRLLLLIIIWLLILGAALAAFEYRQMDIIKTSLDKYRIQAQDNQHDQFVNIIIRKLTDFDFISLQVLAGCLSVTCLLLWLSAHFTVKRALKDYKIKGPPPQEKKQGKSGKPAQKPKEKQINPVEDQRRALHLLSLLQREARLVDFLCENLEFYDDTQIGAAVRNIQENSQKALQKYIAPKAIIDQNEGEEISIEAGFDPSAIKLMGNVSGDPPYKGILQHRGWRSTQFDLPILSGIQDPTVIAPAEVEISLSNNKESSVE
ncbi:MAG: DUF2760 domain-containing protein [Deltaproteobacteria bacterium]|nr:DUF2760 domain-containing protein [Deltaproteobacteria bacterium]